MKPTFKEYLINEATYHGWREPEATDFQFGKTVRSPQLKRGMLLGIKYQNSIKFIIEVLGFTGNDKKYGEGGILYNSAKEMLSTNKVSTLKELEELDHKNEYGYGHYMKARDLVDKKVGPWFYIFKGKWVIGSSADTVTFIEAKYVPSKDGPRVLSQVHETPFTDRQEQRFLTTLGQDVDKRDSWPSPHRITKMVKDVSPKAKKIGSGGYSDAYGRDRSSMVIKLTHGGDGAETLRFLKWAKQKKNPHLPKVYSIKKIQSAPKPTEFDDFWGSSDDVNVYARMERLVPLHPNKYKWKPEHVPFLEWMFLTDHGDRPEYIVGGDKWRKLKSQASRQRIYSSKLVQALKMVTRLAGIDDFDELDITLISDQIAHNLMVRPSTGEIVIHDPF